MDPKQATPGEGGRQDREHFVYYSPDVGLSKTKTGYCACKPHWFRVHEHTKALPGTKVCTEWFTDGEVPCARCRPFHTPTVVAYVLWWRESDMSPLFSIVHETACDLLVGLDYGVRVFVGREEAKASAFMKRCETQSTFKSTHPLRQRAVPILPVLLDVWRIPLLEQWVLKKDRQAKRREEAPPPPAPPVPPPPLPCGSTTRYAQKQEKQDRDAALNEMRMGNTMRKLLNGKLPKSMRKQVEDDDATPSGSAD